MKYFVLLSLLAVASASIIPPAIVASDNPEVQEILAAIQHPSTDPATAAVLEQMLLDILGYPKPEEIAVGPAIIEQPEEIAIGPALIDFPLPDGGALTENPIVTAPVAPAPTSPLVQIILNIRSPSDVAVDTVQSPPVSPVQVVEQPIDLEPVIVVDQPIIPEPVIVVDKPIAPEPVIVVEKPEALEPVIVAQPIIPVPVINLPDILIP